MRCPCCSGKNYEECCAPWHEGKWPEEASQLMRSRYSAYALGQVDYIIKTTHPLHKEGRVAWDKRKKRVEDFSRNTLFLGLEILSFESGESVSFVTFHAKLQREGVDASFTERSRFEKVDGHWLYLSGTIQ